MDIKYEVNTNKTFLEAIDSLTQALGNHQFGVLWKLNFKDKLKEKGLDFAHNFMILEVCNPPQAKEALTRHLDIGYFLPCKMVVYETDNHVKIGFIKPSAFGELIQYDDIGDLFDEVGSILMEAINEAK